MVDMSSLRLLIMAAAVAAAVPAGYGAANTPSSSSSCYFLLSCASDRSFHPVKNGKDAVPLIKMYVENHGWSVMNHNKDPTFYRETSFHRTWLEYNDKGDPFNNDQRDVILAK